MNARADRSRRRASAALSSSLLLLGSLAAAAEPPPECRCRAPGGGQRDLGTVECFEIGARAVVMRCEMSTNTPYWKPMDGRDRHDAEGGCPAPA